MYIYIYIYQVFPLQFLYACMYVCIIIILLIIVVISIEASARLNTPEHHRQGTQSATASVASARSKRSAGPEN